MEKNTYQKASSKMTQDEILNKEFQEICGRLVGTKIFGIEVGLLDARALVIAAYYLGRRDIYTKIKTEIEHENFDFIFKYLKNEED